MALNYVTAERLGWWADNISSSSATRSLPTNTWAAFGFLAPATTSITSVRVYVTGTTSSPAAADFKAEVYSHDYTNWRPNALVNAGSNAASSPSVGFNDFTGFSGASVTQGTYYWIVLKNNGGAASVTIRKPDRAVYPAYSVGTMQTMGMLYKETLDGGTNWGNDDKGNTTTIRIGFADGSYLGFPIQSVHRYDENVLLVQSAKEIGMKFTTPAVQARVVALEFQVGKLGSPAGTVRARLYKGTNLVATTNAYTASQIPANACSIPFFFSSVQVLDASSVYRAVVAATGSDTSSNGFTLNGFQVDSNAASLALMPWQGTGAVTTLDGTWTDTTSRIVGHYLVLDDTPFTAAAGGGLKSNQQMSAMG
jgi:hypothetical protein